MNDKKINNTIVKSAIVILFTILPLLFILIGHNFKQQITHYDLNSVDAEMTYLYNGLTITQGHICYSVEHPGIPLQYISAGVIFIVHLFRDGTINEDVIQNPNVYLHAITYTLIFLNAIFLFILGFFTYKLFKNIFAGLFIQLTPFISLFYLSLSNRLLPEFFSLVVVVFMFLLVAKYIINKEKNNISNKYIYSLLFAILIGFAISIKITLATFGIIPLFVLKSFREKIKYIIFSILSILVFLIPVLYRWDYFSEWVKKLFFHSGQYGQGSSNIVDKNLYKQNLLSIIDSFPIIVTIICILLLGVIFYFIPQLKIRRKKDNWFIAYLSFIGVIIITILIIAKQLKFNYIQPYFLMTIPSLFLLILMINRNKFIGKHIYLIAFIITSLIVSVDIKPAFSKYESNSLDRQYTQKIISKQFKNVPFAAASDYYGSPFYGYSTHYGNIYSSINRRKELLPLLIKLLPDFYSYHLWNKRFNYWDDKSYSLPELMKKYDSLYLYLGNADLNKLYFNKINGINRKLEWYQEIVFSNDKTSEYIVKLKKNLSYIKSWEVSSNLETKDESKYYFKSDNGLNIWGAEYQNSSFSNSGKYSLELNNSHMYGLVSVLTDVEKNEHYIASTWRLKNGNTKSGLVFEISNQNKLYKIETTPIEEKNGWEKIQIELIINDNLKDEDVKFFCFQNGDPTTSYWDDFKIEKNIVKTH